MGNPNPSPHTRFKPGNPGGTGRKKLLARVDEKLHAARIHPVDELLKLYATASDRDKIKIMLELLGYVQAKPKELIFDEDDFAQKTTQELLKIIKENIPDLEAG